MARAQLVLYGRSYCHLCEDMQVALAAFAPAFDFAVTPVDIDVAGATDPALLARYDELVPVLTLQLPDGSERQICHYHLDHAALRTVLTGCGAARSP